MPENRPPDDELAPDAVADRSADDGARRHRGQKQEQVELRVLHRHVKLVHQVEREIVGQADQVEVLGEDQRDQDGHGQDHFCAWAGRVDAWPGAVWALGRGGRFFFDHAPTPLSTAIPSSATSENQAMLRWPLRQHDERRQQRAGGGARIPADLKQRLRQAVLSARGQARHPRRLRMEDRRAHAHQHGCAEQRGIGGRDRQHQQARPA